MFNSRLEGQFGFVGCREKWFYFKARLIDLFFVRMCTMCSTMAKRLAYTCV